MKISALTTFVCLATLALGAMAGTDQVHVTTAQQQQQQQQPASTPAPAPVPSATTATPAKTVGTPAPASTIKSVETPVPATKTGATPAPTTTSTKTVAPSTPSSTKSGATPAPTTAKAAATPAPTTSKPISGTEPSKSHCWYVSVEGDATYCIPGPICSGNGKTPAGVNCPLKGDIAVESCLKTLRSYVDADKCVAPVDAECKLIKTGAWGCVWKGVESVGSLPAKSPATPAPTGVKGPGAQATPAPTGVKGPGAQATPAPTGMKGPGAQVTPAPTGVKDPKTHGKAGGNTTQHEGHSEHRSKHGKSKHCV